MIGRVYLGFLMLVMWLLFWLFMGPVVAFYVTSEWIGRGLEWCRR